MKTFKVPIEKSESYRLDFFMFLSNSMQELLIEFEKWPDSIIFTGKLGSELNQIIIDQGWDFSQFKVQNIPNGNLNRIIFGYQSPLKISTNKSLDGKPSYLRAGGLNNLEINGIPDSNTINKMLSHSLDFRFSLEKTHRPTVEILLER